MEHTANLIIRLLDLFLAGSVAFERFQEMRERLAAMKAEGRDPDAAEWESLFAEIEENTDKLDAADKRLNG